MKKTTLKSALILLGFMAFSIPSLWADITLWDHTPDVPFKKLLDIQVSIKMRCPFHTPTASDIQKKLNKELLQSAKKYHADALAEVKYFPAPEKPSYFRHHEYYAQAVLIQYVKFPSTAPAPQQNAANANY